jgi:hypothetical protein
MTSAAMRGLGLTLLVERPRWAVLSAGELAVTAERLSDLPDAALDAVVLRRAWADRAEAMHLLAIAFCLLRSGGILVAAEVDADTLLEGPTVRYPTSSVWRRADGLAAALRSSSLSPAVLSTDAVAARFQSVAISRFDEEFGEYPSAGALWGALQERGWRGDTWMTPSQRASFFEALATDRIGGRGVGVTDREPWFAVTAVRP